MPEELKPITLVTTADPRFEGYRMWEQDTASVGRSASLIITIGSRKQQCVTRCPTIFVKLLQSAKTLPCMHGSCTPFFLPHSFNLPAASRMHFA